jgi:hypothetical protein
MQKNIHFYLTFGSALMLKDGKTFLECFPLVVDINIWDSNLRDKIKLFMPQLSVKRDLANWVLTSDN